MTQTGSYHVTSIATNTDAEIRRLNAQVDLFWSLEFELLKKYGLQDGMAVLDCGCGPGRLIELLKEHMPGLRFTGLEMDPHLVEAAGSLLTQRGLIDCWIIQGTAEASGLPDSTYDFIIMRLVLEHVPDPLLALRNLARLLKPGGRIVIISNDFEYHLRTSPPVPQLDRLYEAYCASRRKDGGDPCIGRRLPRLLVQSDLVVAGYEMEVAHSAVIGDQLFLRAEGSGIPAQLVRTGFLDQATLEEMTRSWRAMLMDPAHSIMRPLFVAVGERTSDAAKIRSDPNPEGIGSKEQVTYSSRPQQEIFPDRHENHLQWLMALIRDVMKTKLEDIGKTTVEPDDVLTDLGMDSLTALDLQEKIKTYSGTEIPIVVILDNISIRALADHLSESPDHREDKPEAADSSLEKSEAVQWEEGAI